LSRSIRAAVLGVDGGGTKTHLALASREGSLLAFERGPSSGHEGKGYPACRRVLDNLLRRACRAAGVRVRDIVYGCFGMNGGDLPEDFREIVNRMIRPIGVACPIKVHNDAFIPVFNDGWRDMGIGVTCGGWHKWVGVNGKRWFMQEGRMHPGIRHLALHEIYKVYEGFTEPNPFATALSRRLGFKGVGDFMLRGHYGGGKRPYVRPPGAAWHARFLHVPEFLGMRAARGDRVALGVLDAYGAFSADGVRAVARRLGMSGRAFDVILSGSINAGIPALRRAVARHLRRSEPRARVLGARWKPVRGALVYAMHAAWGGLPPGALSERDLLYGVGK